MERSPLRKLHAILGLLVMLMLVGFSNPTANAMMLDDVKVGPFVDKVVYKIISQNDQQILALQSGEIDMIGDTVDPVYINGLEADADIEVVNHTRNGYGKFIINCDEFPLNITAFRRAFAIALNKTNASANLFDGNAVPIDSPLPEVNPWSIEGDLSYSYYDQNIILANQTLDDAGFFDIDDDGWREAPDGSDFNVEIEVPASSSLSIEIGNLGTDALQAIGIDASTIPNDFYDYITRLNLHGAFDVIFLATNFASYDPTWMAQEFGSDYYHIDYFNPSNWKNSTFDTWAEQLLNNASYTGVLEAVTNMQEIVIHSSPEIMIYSNTIFSAYRIDQFEGQINDQAKGAYNTWTNIKTHLMSAQGGPSGGVFDISLTNDIDSFNFMTSSSASTMLVLDNLYMSLFKTGPDGELIPYLAQTCTIETHDDNPTITEGHTRFTVDILQNATWSDLVPLTADDVAFTFNYYRDSFAYGNPLGVDLSGLTAAYAPTTYQVVLEFDTESYWHFDLFAYDFIIPEHIFSSIGLSGWNSWNPVFGSDSHVTCGPFLLSYYASGEFVELVANPIYPYHVPIPPTLSGPDDFSAIEGSKIEITWKASDDNPVVYFVLENGTQMVGDFWYGGNITYSTYAPMPGYVLNITVIVWDADAQYANDTVLVTGLQDTLAPEFIVEPDDLEYTEGDTGITLYWEYFDHNVASIDLYLDGSIIYSDLLGEHLTNFTWNVDGLSVGVYNYTLFIDDIWAHSSTSTVIVSVVEANEPPVVSEPLMVVLLKGDATNNVTWTAFDSDPDTYVVFLNGTEIDSGSWTSGVPIIVDLSSLEIGIYNATIVVSDVAGNTVSNSVMVYVLPSTLMPPIPLETILLISLGIGLAGLVVIVIIVKMKR